MLAGIIDGDDVSADCGVQFRQRKAGRRSKFAVAEIARQLGEQFGVDRAEQPLDLARPCGRATAENMSRNRRSAAACSRWMLVKSDP
jgi:hypothetical protein